MKKYVVKFIDYPSVNEMEVICNDMYTKNYRLVSTAYDKKILYLFFELDEVERRCN